MKVLFLVWTYTKILHWISTKHWRFVSFSFHTKIEARLTRVTIRPAFWGLVPLSRFFHRKSRFLLQSNGTVFTKSLECSINFFTQAGRWDAALDCINEVEVWCWRSRCEIQGVDIKKSGKTGVTSKKKKKKKRSTPPCLPQIDTHALEIHIDHAVKMVMTFFFFFLEIIPIFLSLFAPSRIKSRSASQRPAFGKK